MTRAVTPQTHAAVLDPTGEIVVRRLVGAPEEVVPFLEGRGAGIVAV